jgi:hypothetical protein
MKYEVCQKVMGLAETSCEQDDERNSAAAWNDINAGIFKQKSDAEQYRQALINSYLSRYEQPDEFDREYAETAMCHVREVSDEYAAAKKVKD